MNLNDLSAQLEFVFSRDLIVSEELFESGLIGQLVVVTVLAFISTAFCNEIIEL